MEPSSPASSFDAPEEDSSGPDRNRRSLIVGMVAQCSVGFGLVACGRSSSGQSVGEASPPAERSPSKFPLRVQPDKRYIVDAAGAPFLVHGDVAWSLVGQLTDAEIKQYLDNRHAKGVTAIPFNAPEAYYTRQEPLYLNVDGIAPFMPMADFASPAEAYWRRVDYVVNGAKARGMACIINPAYLGAIGDGWRDAVIRSSAAALRAYGAWLAKRYTQQNIIWCLGGDRDEAISIAKQWNIVLGMRTVRTDAIIMAHPLADAFNADDAYTYWHTFNGFNLNTVYGWEQQGFSVYALCAQAYARHMPFLFFEGQYENEGKPNVDSALLRRQSYGALLSGACGQFFGNNPIWHFDSPKRPFQYSGTWESNLDSTGSTQQTYVRTLFNAYAWWKLVPSTNARLVTSGLGTGAQRLYPAIADDATFAMVYVPRAQNVSINMSALSLQRIRARLYDPISGAYEAVSGSPFTNQGISSIQTPAERVIVLDAA